MRVKITIFRIKENNCELYYSESETWQCMLCFNFADTRMENPADGDVFPDKLKKIIQRLLLELYCQYESSLPFRELVSSDVSISILTCKDSYYSAKY